MDDGIQESINKNRSAEKDAAASLRQNILDKTSFELGGNPNFGVFLVAKRDIKAGEALYEEKAAVWGPDGGFSDIDHETPLCLGCCVLMEGEKFRDKRCNKCGWPLCSSDCEGLEIHAENECNIFIKYGTTFPPPDFPVMSCYALVQIIRGLLLKFKAPDMWALIMTLQWKSQLPRKTHLIDVPSFMESKNMPVQLASEEEWKRMNGILCINAGYNAVTPVHNNKDLVRCGEGLFPLYSFLVHSCSPNCIWVMTYDDVSVSFKLTVFPLVDIRRGDIITVPYTSNPSKIEVGNHKRRRKLQERFKFRCMCSRCQDPTELGSYIDALKCFNCNDSYMLPITAEDNNEDDSYWICELCNYSVPFTFGNSFLELVYQKLLCAGVDSRENGISLVEQIEIFIKTYSNVYLHPNHYILMEAAYVIVQIQIDKIDSNEEIKVEELERFVEVCYYLLNIETKLAPGLTIPRGISFYFLSRSLFRKFCLKQQRTTTGDYDHHNIDIKLQNDLLELAELQSKCLQIWDMNPVCQDYDGDNVFKLDKLREEAEICNELKKQFSHQ